MNVSLSVIVPVFNVENYLHKCIDSIINQTFKDLEIILVNDGSTDASPKICDDYAQKDVRVKVIHQENAGVSVARNNGINNALGNYVTFVDSDDWLEPSMYETMFAITQSKNASDIIMCDFVTIKNNIKQEVSSNLRNGFYTKQQIINELYPTLLVTEDFGRIPIVSVCSCLFKRSIFVDNKIKFNADLKYSEDYLFMADVMINANSFYYLKHKYFYNYLQYEESRSKKFQAVWWDNLLYLNEELENLLKSNKEFDFTRQIKLQLLHSVLLILNSICKNDGMDFYTKRKEIKFIVNQPKLTQVFSNLSLKNQRKSLKLILFFIKHKMAFMYLFYFRIITLLKNA